ncbi:SDR family NAD(P)-dependent oxidoreductase [Sporichthya polymorpha]|uniref:SDR family NAD(P)-dependent oxidoreductase n=1 Tax=Sporichthya polymorpha TaxID=35751 RepID=UPI0003A96357|nr:SDR family oxidoreductase [Sporichthya polymorpha]
MPTALITGPTSGIGNAFARRLAADGWDLVLVARDSARLDRVAAELRARSGVEVETFPADLSADAARAAVVERILDETRPIDLLVNNAGMAGPGAVLRSDYRAQDDVLAVMVRAVLQLSHAALQVMAARGHGGIVNVSSVAGFVPRGTYSAAKAYVTNFTESLAEEARGTGVRVVVTCPGFTRTEFHARSGADTDNIPDFLWLSADKVVDDALDALRRGRVVTVPGLQWKVITAAAKHLPVRRIVRATRMLGRTPRSEIGTRTEHTR